MNLNLTERQPCISNLDDENRRDVNCEARCRSQKNDDDEITGTNEQTQDEVTLRCLGYSDRFRSCLVGGDNNESRELVPRDDLIFIIDDARDILIGVSRTLRCLGKELKLFPDASEAMREIDETGELPTIIVTDHNMPNMTGLDLCNRMKEIDETIRPTIIVMSGNDMNTYGNIFFRAGAFAVIQKPNIGELTDAVRSALLMKESDKGLK